MRGTLLGICVLAVGCAAPDGADEVVRFLDADEFAATVQPVLADRCASPSCHGRVERPLALYAPGFFRADPTRTFFDEPLMAAELEHNYAASCVFVTGAPAPAEAALVVKPLAGAVGVYHGGGAVFAGTADPDYRAVLAWIEGGFP